MVDRPNIVVVMYDQLTPSMLGCYGHPVAQSPCIDALAAGGVVFDAAYTNSPLCTPGRYCMMTGQLPSTSGGYDNAAYLASTIPTFAHVARAAGYRTVLSGKMHFVGPDQLHGFEERRTTDIYPADFGWTPNWDEPGQRVDWWYHNMDSVLGAGVAESTNQLRYDDEVGHHAVRALHELAPGDDGRPFLLVASFTHPHDPYVTRRHLWDRYEGVEIPMPVTSAADVVDDPHSARLRAAADAGRAAITDEHVLAARRAYLGNVSYVDDWTGRIVDTLRALGRGDDTVIVLLADHGDMLGERGLWYKMNFFEGSSRIPLVVHAPSRLTPRRVAAPVSLVDVLPTIAELVDVDLGEVAQLAPLAGRSLLALCDGAPGDGADDTEREVIGEYMAEGSVAPIVMIRRGPLKYVHCDTDPDQLYDLASDPRERTNLATDAGWAAKLGELRAEVRARWNLSDLRARVLVDQRRRRYVDRALRLGRHTGWEYTPPRSGPAEYMRNHLDLNEVERQARWPRA